MSALLYPTATAQALFAALASEAWSFEDQYLIHANHTRLGLEERRTPLDPWGRARWHVWLEHPVALQVGFQAHTPSDFLFEPAFQVKTEDLHIGHLLIQTPLTPALVIDALLRQMGIVSWRRLRALSHVLAQDGFEGGAYSAALDDHLDMLYCAKGLGHQRPGHVVDLLKRAALQRFTPSGVWIQTYDLPLKSFASAHETLSYAQEIAWVNQMLAL